MDSAPYARDPGAGRVPLVLLGQFMHAVMSLALAQPNTITPSAMREFRKVCAPYRCAPVRKAAARAGITSPLGTNSWQT